MSSAESPVPSSPCCEKCRKAKKKLRKVLRAKAALWDKHVACEHAHDEGFSYAFGAVVGSAIGVGLCVAFGLIVIPAAAAA